MNIIKSMMAIYTAQITEAKVNIGVLLQNPTAIPEHGNFVKELDKYISSIATAQDKIAVLEKEYEDYE